MLLIQSNGSLFADAWTIFCVAKIDTKKKICSRNFIVILSPRDYFVVYYVYSRKHCTCNGIEV